MEGFNPNFLLTYESGKPIEISFAKLSTNNTKCNIRSY